MKSDMVITAVSISVGAAGKIRLIFVTLAISKWNHGIWSHFEGTHISNAF